MTATKLRCEYLKDPLGIDMQNPRLMWNCYAEQSGASPAKGDAERSEVGPVKGDGGIRQSAYQIVCASNGKTVWDSGKVESSSMQAVYPLPLKSREHIDWKVQLWKDQAVSPEGSAAAGAPDAPGEWACASFEMGLIEPSDWSARWISGDYDPSKKDRYPVDCFMKVFSAFGVEKARLYITACGLYEARLNGKRCGSFVMAPGHTDYNKRVQYQTYDVTDLIRDGKNELSIELADGWYRGSVGAWGLTCEYGVQTKLLAQLELTFSDGRSTVIGTDSSWQWSNDGPIRFADNKDGEVVEAFRTPSYRGMAREVKHSIVPSASNNVPVTEHEHFRPVISIAPNGRWLLDFGQNLAGYVAFRVTAHVGQKMCWRFGEMLDADGNLTLKNIQCASKKKTTPLQQIDYTCGEGLNEYKTRFAVFGFRYAEVETALEIKPDDVEAIAVYSDMEQTGSFESSNELLNKFVAATVWSAKSNSLDVPTDCPTRERHGWTGDAQIFFGTASYFFDYAAFAKKYLRDVFDWQKKDGRLPQIAPYGGVDF